MTLLSDAVPLSEYRTCLAQHLRAVGAAFDSVAGRIIEERVPPGYVRDPLRPSLVLWACAACGGDTTDALPVAAAFDLFDRFLLLHDELADRGAPTVARWGLGQSLNAGDALYALAFRSLAGDVVDPARRLAVARLVAEAVLDAIEANDGDPARDARLTGTALAAGTIIGGAPERVTRAFARAGRLLGTDAARAVDAIRPHVSQADLGIFEEVARYATRRTV